MNDRLKFRVWDKVSKRYFYLELKFGDNGYHPDFITDPVFEQCTGLKDKNGNLIYEGDIIFDGYCNRIIKWGGWFWVAESNSANCPLDEFCINSSKIIGNIHETKGGKDE